jgi:hypothetical protein
VKGAKGRRLPAPHMAAYNIVVQTPVVEPPYNTRLMLNISFEKSHKIVVKWIIDPLD